MKFKKTFRWRVFIAILSIAIVIIIFLAAFIYQWLNSQASKDIERVQMNSVENIERMFSYQVETFINDAMGMYSDANASVLMSGSSSNWYKFAVQYASRALRLISTNQFVDSVMLFDQNEIIVKTQSTNSMTAESFESFHKSALECKGNMFFSQGDALQRDETIPLLCITFGERNFPEGNLINGIIMTVNLKEMSKTLLGSSADIYIVDNDANIILASDMKKYGQNLVELGVIGDKEILANERISEEYKVDAGKYNAYGVRAAGGTYVVVSIQKQELALFSQHEGIKGLIITVLAISLLTLLAAYIMSVEVSKPVDELVDDIIYMHEDKKEDPEYRTNLAFARASLTETTNRIKTMQAAHKRDSQIRYLLGAGNTHMDYPFEEDAGGLVAVAEVADISEDIDINIVSETFASVLLEAVSWICTILVMNNSRLVLIFSREYDDEVDTVLPNLRRAVSELLNAQVTLATSCSDEDASLKTRYDIACRRIRMSAFHGNECIYTREFESTLSNEPFAKAFIRRAGDILKNYDEAEAVRFVNELFDQAASRPYELAVAQLEEVEKAVISTVLMPVVGNNIKRPGMGERLSRCTKPDEVRQVLAEFLVFGKAAIKSAQQVGSQDVLLHAIEYIRQHYTDTNISMQSVASYVNISSSHFSRRFSEYVGMPFPKYINTLRLEHAHKLLLETDMTISEIAKQVGFYSSSYFTSAFSKKYSLSPSQVRKYNIVKSKAESEEDENGTV